MVIPAPIVLLGLMIALTAAAWLASHLHQQRRNRVLSRLAREAGMHFSETDRLTLTPRVAANLPIIGAAAVRVSDVLYRSGASGHVYLFTAEYTSGVVKSKKRVRRVATFSESRDRQDRLAPNITLAPIDCDVVGQYRALLATLPQT